MIDKKLALVPHKPGCYLMKDKNGIIIYVGKSKNLKNRLSSYFKASHTGKTAMLVRDIVDFDYVITSSELESLLLEINLIKKHDPKYNILLRDDKSYPYIEITNEKAFRLKIVRNPRIKKGGNNKLFGPYPNVTAAKRVVDMLNRIYPLRKCKNYEKKVCLYYHIKECLGYCEYKVADDVIENMRSEIISFFNGNSSVVTKRLETLMHNASEKLQFERAMEYKDLLEYVSITLEKQKVELDDNINRDVIGYYFKDGYMVVAMLFIRGGKLLDHNTNIFPMIDEVYEELMTYISKFYDKHKIKPREVIVPDIVSVDVLKNAFEINFFVPKRGKKKNLLDLASENARNYYNEQMTLILKDDERTSKSLEELANILEISSVRRIELFDNSNLFGTFNVSGMVVFIDGKPCKNEYRKFKITNDVNDDYGTMREVIYRRYFRVLKDNLPPPDLIIVDGGEGQLNVARSVLRELDLNIPTAGLKKDDKHNTNTLVGLDPIRVLEVDKRSNLFFLLTKMQDEVHNFTINYHRQIRSKGLISSVLDNIEGIGEVRKNKLLKKYRSVSAIKKANIEEIDLILPHDVSVRLLEVLNNIEN